jgi:15-cis-phytoene desaturase
VALADAGFRVRLFEAEAWFGGRARSFKDDVTGETVDIGPHVISSEHRNMLALMERLGTRNRVVWQTEEFITLVDDGRAVPMRMYRLPAPFHFLPNFFRVEKLSASDIWSARRVLLTVMRMNEEDVLRHDDANALDMLHDLGVSRTFIDWFWRTVCMAIMNVPLEQCSAGSLMRFLKMMAGHADFHFGFPATGLADLFAPGGVHRITAAGGEVRHSLAARTVCIENGAVDEVVLETGESIRTRRCVVAVPPQALSKLLPETVHLQDSGLAGLSTFQPSPYISVYLWFSKKLTEERFWARVWSPATPTRAA